jgi:hypothetical protein
MTWNEWILAVGLSIPALALAAWIRLVRKEMKDQEKKKSD